MLYVRWPRSRAVDLEGRPAEPHALWITYLVPELVIPWIISAAQVMTNRQMAGGA
ncbi:hypothetical protein AB8A31_24760 [Tardiphaga sp. 804_B3_N1_9]|uniref:hypothetical protein n=1 Tax=Tardiphaga TaxID=1395974 RepID=UPI001586C937|nr:hypothetical protein [Tardiphaga robiniae]NUU44241.1 hypothetical protein [Tardiphaga robiniae]